MAKKSQAAQLQLEINNDEEWEKLLEKEDLIDIYSEWCGPCLGMQGILKKIKLEFGGDLLLLAVAKSDGISMLERFRNKSEPTWMLISDGKMVKLMFGTDAPKLTTLIMDELKKEKLKMEGQSIERELLEITELSEEERQRNAIVENAQRIIREKEERKKAKELLERRTKECEQIIHNVPNMGVAIIFPSAKDKYKEVLKEILDEAGLVITDTQKIDLTEDILEELCYFSKLSEEFSDSSIEELINNQCIILLFKVASRAYIEDIDNAIIEMIYGDMKRPPGSPDSAAQKLLFKDENTEDTDKNESVIAIWVPLTPEIRATALRLFFPKITKDMLIAEPVPEPDHFAIIFPLDKSATVMPIVLKYPNEVLKRGYFTTSNPDNAKLVAKTYRKLVKLPAEERTFSENLVLKVSKQKSECMFAFAQLEPLYISANTEVGRIDCKKFFPESEEDEEMEIVEEEEIEEEEEEKEEPDLTDEELEGEEEPVIAVEDLAEPNESVEQEDIAMIQEQAATKPSNPTE